MEDSLILRAIKFLMIGSGLQFVALIILDIIFFRVEVRDVYTYDISFATLNDLGFLLALISVVLFFAEYAFLFLFFRTVLPRFSRAKFMKYVVVSFMVLTLVSRLYVLFIIILNTGASFGLTEIFQVASGFAFTAYFIPALSSTFFGYIFYEIGKERFSYGFGQGLRYFGLADIVFSAPMLLISLLNVKILSSWNFLYFAYYWKIKFFPLVALWILDIWSKNVRDYSSPN